jgi:spermidine synthase
LYFTTHYKIATVQTDFQRIDIFDVKQTFEKESLLVKDPLYKSSNSHLYEPERIVYLDGVIQSTRKNLEAYHEGLVHPAMFANKNPKNVAIIGGGEGATLKEVLKHNTLQKVKMIEIDEQMVYASREYLPEWSDCSDIIGSEKWCGDDKRAEMYYEDALGWFIDRYSETGKFYNENHTKLDVIIMDALYVVELSFLHYYIWKLFL